MYCQSLTERVSDSGTTAAELYTEQDTETKHSHLLGMGNILNPFK
jgi:hypothetical protein